tara:strand:+ start:42 stop:743 length:702 start_codon:yes stop_codon:yes gene_type:complete
MSLGKFEKEEQELYFEQYKIQSGISKNYGQNFYDLLSSDLKSTTEFHIEQVYDDTFKKCTTFPDSIKDVLDFKNKNIFDFGCGNGKFCNDAVEKYNATKAYGVDIATIDLKIVDEYKSDKCEFISGGATDIPLSDKSIDITTAFLVLEHVHEPNIDKMFEELYRVTEKGFIFAISHGEANSVNLRRCSKPLNWWYEKIKRYSDDVFLYYPKSDNYKWGTGWPIGYSRLICKLK